VSLSLWLLLLLPRTPPLLVALRHGRRLAYTRQLGLLATGEQYTLAADAPSAPHSFASFFTVFYLKRVPRDPVPRFA